MVVPAPRAILLSPDSAETECNGKLNRKTHAPIKSSAPAPPTVYLDRFDILPPLCFLMFILLVYIPEKARSAFLESRLPVHATPGGSMPNSVTLRFFAFHSGVRCIVLTSPPWGMAQKLDSESASRSSPAGKPAFEWQNSIGSSSFCA